MLGVAAMFALRGSGPHPLRILVMAFALGALLVFAPTASAQVEPPTLPDLAAVGLDPSTTAFLVLDINSAVCPSRPACLASVPAIQRLLSKARAADVFVGYSNTANATILPDIAPRDSDPVVTSRADKFFNTDLDQILKDHGIQTVVMVGAAANGAVMYTSFGAVERGYTVVVATDGISSGPDFDTFLAEYQMLNMPGFANADNNPLQPTAATLTRGDMITFTAVAK
jgi:nicotinamidase-related amidase